MVKFTAKKPPGVKSSFQVPSWAVKLGGAAVVIGAVVLVSVLVSPEESRVEVLTDASFYKFLSKHQDGALVEFSKKSCPFCDKLKPEYEKAARQIAADGGAPFAIIDSEEGQQVMQKLGIDKYPMVYWFWKGENTMELTRAAEKTSDQISEWVKWAQSPALQVLNTRAEMEEGVPMFRQSLAPDHKLLVAYNRSDVPLLYDIFEHVAQKYRTGTLFLFIEEQADDGPLVKAFAKEEEKDAELTDKKGLDDILNWVKLQVEETKLKALEKSIEVNKAKLAQLQQEEAEAKAKEAAGAAEGAESAPSQEL